MSKSVLKMIACRFWNCKQDLKVASYICEMYRGINGCL